jgi:flagellar biosynthesis/type III secretory pathway protein FliH
MTISRDEVARVRLESEYKYELDTQSRITYARQEGRQEGIREGEQKGWQERNREILKLLESGYSAEDLKERLKAEHGR